MGINITITNGSAIISPIEFIQPQPIEIIIDQSTQVEYVLNLQSKEEQETTIELLPALLVGDSAYEVAVKNGFIGTEEEWLLSLNGSSGDSWINLATGYSIEPFKIDATIGYEVYQYGYTSMTLYRKISLVDLEDAFYGSYVNGIFSNLIAMKQII